MNVLSPYIMILPTPSVAVPIILSAVTPLAFFVPTIVIRIFRSPTVFTTEPAHVVPLYVFAEVVPAKMLALIFVKLALPMEESIPSFSQLLTHVPTYLSAGSAVGVDATEVAGAVGVVARRVIVAPQREHRADHHEPEKRRRDVALTVGVSGVISLSLPLQATSVDETRILSKPVYR